MHRVIDDQVVSGTLSHNILQLSRECKGTDSLPSHPSTLSLKRLLSTQGDLPSVPPSKSVDKSLLSDASAYRKHAEQLWGWRNRLINERETTEWGSDLHISLGKQIEGLAVEAENYEFAASYFTRLHYEKLADALRLELACEMIVAEEGVSAPALN